jgi:hypothetical protein
VTSDVLTPIFMTGIHRKEDLAQIWITFVDFSHLQIEIIILSSPFRWSRKIGEFLFHLLVTGRFENRLALSGLISGFSFSVCLVALLGLLVIN